MSYLNNIRSGEKNMVDKGIYTRLTISFAIALLATLTMIASLFLTQLKATDEWATSLDAGRDNKIYSTVNITYEDMKELSIVEFALVMGMASSYDTDMAIAGAGFLIMLIFISIFLLLNLLFSLIKKPIPLIIFNILAFGVFCLQKWIYGASGIMDFRYEWGIGYYTYIVGSVVLFASSIWMMINKAQLKNSKEATMRNY